MAHEPPSPAASTVLLPLLGGTRSRRGSLASITSRKEIDKDALALALDHIHTSASKSEALTSFHDFDGGAGSRQAGPKEYVSSGVSGLYNKFKQSVGGGTPVKDARQRPESSASRDSGKSASFQSISPAPSRLPNGLSVKTKGSNLETASLSTTSVSASPVVASFVSGLDKGENSGKLSKHDLEGSSNSHNESRIVTDDEPVSVHDHAPDPAANFTSQEMPSKADIDRARSALRDEDRSEGATQALARVLSHHEVPILDKPKQSNLPTFPDRIAQSMADESEEDDTALTPMAAPTALNRVHLPKEADDASESSYAEQRPQLVRVGASHLPNFVTSRTPSPGLLEPASSSSSQIARGKPLLEPSPNFNAGLQRRRTGLKQQPQATSMPPSVPAHLKKRVISKEFWMKDVNAKVCFYCGESFSTFRRKHHCRTCGQIFDSKCTVLVQGRPFGQPGTLRLCKNCEDMVLGSHDDDSSVFSDDGADSIRTPITRRPTITEDHLPQNFDGIASSLPDAGELMTPSIGIPVSRRNREAKRRSAVIEFDAQPSLARPSSSRSLVSLSGRPRSSSHKRHLSRHQVMRGWDERAPFHQDTTGDPEKTTKLPAFHNDNIIDPDLADFLSDDGSDYEDEPQSLFSAIAGDARTGSHGDRERMGISGFFTSAMKKGKNKNGDRATIASSARGGKDEDGAGVTNKHLPKLSRKRNPSISSINMGRPSPRRSRSNMLLKTVEHDDHEIKPQPSTIGLGSSGSRVIRSSAMHGAEAPPVELNRASLDHVKKLLLQLLNDAKIEHAPAWEKALVPVLLQCTDDVEPDVQRGDDMDIRHYIKLKKVAGGRPGDTSYVSGVVFSKNVALKSMARSIPSPRIAIVTFAIEYARHQAHFMSLEPVIAQEREYLHVLVGRIAALRPHLLLVQKNVSGLALRLLEQAGITVAFNIKESVLAAVARVTQTTMIKSVDKLAIDPSHLGQCGSFDVKTYQHQGIRKTYIVLSGCAPDLGCTIVLRGTNTKTLRTIKRIAEFMCYVVYNLKLETALMRDEFVSIPSTRPEQLSAPKFAGDEVNPQTPRDETLPSKYGRVEQETRARVLSASPFVVFMQPFMLAQLKEQEENLARFKQLRDHYAAADEEGDDESEDALNDRFELVKPEMVHASASKNRTKAVREYLHAVHSAQFERTLASYDNQRKLWESFVSNAVSPFDPYSHQTIVLLHSTVSSLTSAPCIGPELLGIGFYAGYNHVEPQFEEDCTLGQYVEDLCLSANGTCKECNRKMYDHHRQYVHGYGQLAISVQRQPTRVRGLSNTILMWSSCRVCRAETTIVPMSDNTWKYSFAKYLELTFWSSPLHPRAGVCDHDIHKDFLRCFGFQDLVVRVQYDPVDIYDIIVPKPVITWKVEADLVVKNEQYVHFETRLTAFIESIKKRLSSINVDTLDEKEMIEAQEMIEALRQRAEDDHRELTQKLQSKYGTSRYYELIPLNRALRFMDEKALAWDEAFNNFERDYFPSETDIRKLAAAQLKEMFYGSHSTTDSVASDNEDSEGTEMTAMPSKSVGQRIADEELESEKAHGMLTSVAQEHRASRDENGVKPTESAEAQVAIGSELSKQLSPLEEQEQAVEREEVKHLDLAVAARSPEDNVVDGRRESEQSGNAEGAQDASAGATSPEPFAIQPKPLSSGLLQRIEQIRNNRAANPDDTEVPESKIPRLVELKKRDVLAIPPPPLIRAQSQPAHIPCRSADMTGDSLDAIISPPQAVETPPIERRFGDRLGQIGNKLGKLPPSLIPRSIPTKEPSVSSSVSALAKHFEQMSREFEKERLKERRQRAAKSRQARANPLASSRPVVEVYQNATDAVGEQAAEHADGREEVLGESIMDGVSRVDQAPKPQPPGLDEMQQVPALVNSTTHSPAPKSREQHATDAPETDATDTEAETEAEGSDAETVPFPARSRDHSDPLSTISGPTLLSPSAQDLEFHPGIDIPEHKKNVWFKMLADFWSKRSASGWTNLEYPLHSTEHVFEDSDIIVREDEPSSVIALSLACADYQVKVKQFRSSPNKNPRSSKRNANTHAHTTSTTSASFADEDDQARAIEASLLSDTGTHMKYSFAHGPVKASCKIFYAESFDALRRRCGVSTRFVESMSRCLKFDSKGGKTKSLFLKSLDNRFIIKSLQEVELKAFTKFAPDYFAFMSYTLFHGVPSVIAKMFGLFQVIIKNPATGMDFSYYLLVMENLFYEQNPNRRFDLKGSMRNRKIESTGQPDEVLLDENLVETIFESPLFVRTHARKLLQASVWNDTLWLCKQNVMDYSLMAGFDDTSKTLVVGIIDCIRTYTWDKKLESWIKDRGKNKPTITSPKDYRNRFRVSMMQYVLQAPNCWHQFHAQMAAPKTLIEGEGE